MSLLHSPHGRNDLNHNSLDASVLSHHQPPPTAMAGVGARKKRPSASFSSCFSLVTVAIFLAFCGLGAWMLTSSSSSSSIVTSRLTRTTRSSLRSYSPRSKEASLPPPAFDDNPGDLPEDAIKEDLASSGEEKQESDDVQMEEQEQVEGEKKDEVKEEVEVEKPSKEEDEDLQKPIKEEEENEAVAEKRSKEEENEVVAEKQSKEEEDEAVAEKRNKEEEDEAVAEKRSKEEEDEAVAEKRSKEEDEAVAEKRSKEEEDEVAAEKRSKEEDERRRREQLISDENEEKQTLLELPKSETAEDDKPQSVGEGNGEESEGEKKGEGEETRSQVVTDSSGGSEENAGGGVRVEEDAEAGGGMESSDSSEKQDGTSSELENSAGKKWELCNTTAGADYIPCLDNSEALKKVHSTGHFEHRERHCPREEPTCLVQLPKGYRRSIEWPRSRDKIWYNNVPHTKLAEVKGHQNWLKVAGEYLNFPGGGTQFIHGALHYIDFIQKAVPRIAWGKHTRVILDVGCGVASFGGFLFERDVLTMSFAPKDEHEAQVQFALERGIPAISAVMGTQRLPFPSRVFDIVHCARCRVPWHNEGGRLLLELNRVLRPGGYFVWSATPVYQKLQEDIDIWNAMSELTSAMCWDLVNVKKDRINSIGAAIYRKPVSNECYDNRKNQTPPMCKDDDDSSAAWYVPLQSCMHKVPIHSTERGSQWPADWPQRLVVPPYWLNNDSVYGKSAKEDFAADYERWKKVIEKSYLKGMGISWSKIRNVMDMKAFYGGFAAALKDLNIWVMNVVNIDSQDTLPIIYERGLFGIYHDWCESFSTYPRSYDLLHADHLFSGLKKRCDILPVVVEVDRIMRPGGTFIIRDESATATEVENLLKSLHWDVRMTFFEGNEGILCAEKTDWRPEPSLSSS